MTKRLIVMRHAKSDWSDADLSDHARVLNARGRRACDTIGTWMAERGYVPDMVLCSSSARTRETWARIAPHVPGAAEVTLRDDLYLAEPEVLFDAVADARGECLALLAHNPGIGAFADSIVTARPDHRAFAAYPTLATLVADFQIDDWSMLAPSSGRVFDFIVPRDLSD